MAYRLAPEAEAEIDAIWLYLATESQNTAIADRFVEQVTERLVLLANYPHLGRSRTSDLGQGLRSFPVGDYVIFYRAQGQTDVYILHIIHGARDLNSLRT